MDNFLLDQTVTPCWLAPADPNMTPGQANGLGWHINWTAQFPSTDPEECAGSTIPGETNWIQYSTTGIYVDVDTEACDFTTAPLYLTSLGGDTDFANNRGATSIYAATATGFRIYT